jgi:hypothetical protein
VWRGLAPTTATDRGANSLSRRYVDIFQIKQEGYEGTGSALRPRLIVDDICSALKSCSLLNKMITQPDLATEQKSLPR